MIHKATLKRQSLQWTNDSILAIYLKNKILLLLFVTYWMNLGYDIFRRRFGRKYEPDFLRNTEKKLKDTQAAVYAPEPATIIG